MNGTSVTLIIIVFSRITEVLLFCKSLEEGQSLVLTSNATLKEKTIVFYHDDQLMSTCRRCSTCVVTFPKNSTSNITILRNGSCIYTFTYTNITRQQVSTWIKDNDLHGHTLNACNLTVYAQPKEMKCVVGFSVSDLRVMCSASKIYPMGDCHHSITLNGNSTALSSPDMINRSECLGLPRYCQINCILTIFTNNLTLGQYDLSVTVYPNVTGSLMDLSFGTSWNQSFRIAEQDNFTQSLNCSFKNVHGPCWCKEIEISENVSLYALSSNEICFHEAESNISNSNISKVDDTSYIHTDIKILIIASACGPIFILSVLLCWKRNVISACSYKEKKLINKR
ncbi:unnamed protein product [Lymnaea stagnalis]|uniref:Uncharacterized protein n=1 Tax=Lymnaea stagnalis TaxID=6523 RepID=A0AAV2H5B0_LYMST